MSFHVHIYNYATEPSLTSAIAQIVQQVRPYTMVPTPGIEFLIRAAHYIVQQEIAGDWVECGVWQGGCAAALRLAENAFQAQSQRHLHLFDSYAGLPPVQPIDGPMAARWQQATDDPNYFDNCAASLELVQQNFKQLDILTESVQFHPGWFETTVPNFAQANPEAKIAILRLDGDWYESTKVCLEHLYPLVVDKGIVIIDDYYAWDGCALAVHEFLGAHRLNHRLCSPPDLSFAYFIKQPWRD
jgi:O-methyltransferase